ncbi:hypothetical protein EVAR_7436_1 [Eumeta japonica]|uniref:Uncharacterized protein n=1 Tax=Eumeta variegata TaxID=151549 RepID=A0A4C1V6F1_EUMVA|nr:hypothetical protein EVAR_7436_1 [Eumeta japonica]
MKDGDGSEVEGAAFELQRSTCAPADFRRRADVSAPPPKPHLVVSPPLLRIGSSTLSSSDRLDGGGSVLKLRLTIKSHRVRSRLRTNRRLSCLPEPPRSAGRARAAVTAPGTRVVTGPRPARGQPFALARTPHSRVQGSWEGEPSQWGTYTFALQVLLAVTTVYS